MGKLRIVAIGFLAASGLAAGLALASSSNGGPGAAPTLTFPTTNQAPPSNATGAICGVAAGTVTTPSTPPTIRAGESTHMASCNWFPRTTCTNRVHFTLTANSKDYDLGSLRPTMYAASLQVSLIPIKPNLSSPIDGNLTVPDVVNVGQAPVPASIVGRQILDFGFPVLGCVDLTKKQSAPLKVSVTPAATDSTVITDVQPPDGTVLRQGTPLQLAWTLSRAGEVRVHVYYELTPGRELSVLPQTNGSDAVLDAQRSAGANQLTVPLADASGHAYPAGSYRFQIELIDPAGSMLVPAKPKTGSFTVALAS